MKIICQDISKLQDTSIFVKYEEKYGFKFPSEMIDFFKLNNGGVPDNRVFVSSGESFEIRCFLSFNEGEYNSIGSPMEYYQIETKGKIIPLAKDSGDNYFCMHVESGKIYYQSHEDELYYRIFDSFGELVSALTK